MTFQRLWSRLTINTFRIKLCLWMFSLRSTLQNYLKKHEGKDVDAGNATSSNPFDKCEIRTKICFFVLVLACNFLILCSNTVSFQWHKSLACLSPLHQALSSIKRPPTASTSCPCCCAFVSAAVTSPFWRRSAHFGILSQDFTISGDKHVSLLSVQTLDSSELQGDGIVLSLEEQLNALSLSSSPSPSDADLKDTVLLNGSRFPSRLFEDANKSTKVGTNEERSWWFHDSVFIMTP